NQIFATGRLFAENTVLPATPLYPGMEAITAALMHFTGLDVFAAGMVLIGLARLLLLLALFLVYEQLSRSPYAAGLACVIYAGNANFLYWGAQFSYESLALPLASIVLFLVVRREQAANAASPPSQSERVSLTVAALMGITAVVVTHHLSSYFLAGLLAVWMA